MAFFRKKNKVQIPKAVAADGELLAVIAAAVAAQNDELFAVIGAAVAAYESDAGSNIIVRKINRSTGVRPAWGLAGTNEAINV